MTASGAFQVNDTKKANADLSAQQYQFVQLSAADTVSMASGPTGEANYGVLQNKPAAAGRAAEVTILGFTKVKASTAITANALITSNTSGKAVTSTSAQVVLGRALTAAGAENDIIEAFIHPPWYHTN